MKPTFSHLTLLQKSFPSILSLSIEPIAGMVDTILIGQYAPLSIGSLAFSNSIVSAFFWMLSFLSTTLMTHTARADTGSLTVMNQKFTTSLIIASIFSGLIAISVIFNAIPLFNLYEIPPEAQTETSHYLWFRLASLPFALFCSCTNSIFRGFQSFHTQLVPAVLLTFLNIVISSYLVIFEEMTVIGCGLGTFLSFFITAFVGFYWLNKKHQINISFPNWEFLSTDFLSLQKDSANVFFRTGSLVFSLWIMTVAASRIDSTTLAAHQIQLQVWLFASCVLDGLAVTATAMGGRSSSEGRMSEFQEISQKFLNLSYFVGISYGLICWLFFPLIIRIFTHDPNIHTVIAQPWFMMATLQCIGAAVYLYDGLLYSLAEFAYMRKRMVEGCLFIFLPILYYLQHSFQGIWLAFLCFIVYRFLTGCWYFHKKFKSMRLIPTYTLFY